MSDWVQARGLLDTGLNARVHDARARARDRDRQPDVRVSPPRTGARRSLSPHPAGKLIDTGLSPLGFTLMDRINRVKSRLTRRLRGPRANPGGCGRGTLEINFETTIVLT